MELTFDLTTEMPPQAAIAYYEAAKLTDDDSAFSLPDIQASAEPDSKTLTIDVGADLVSGGILDSRCWWDDHSREYPAWNSSRHRGTQCARPDCDNRRR